MKIETKRFRFASAAMLLGLAVVFCGFGREIVRIPDPSTPASFSRVDVYLTARDTGDRLASHPSLAFSPLPQPDESDPTIMLDPSRTFQTIEGFGGALTDAAAETYYRLPEKSRRELLSAYFDPGGGIGYSLCRTHINSCDFSSASYAYDETPGDKRLEHFSIDHDRRFRIPFIKEALAEAHTDTSQNSYGPEQKGLSAPPIRTICLRRLS